MITEFSAALSSVKAVMDIVNGLDAARQSMTAAEIKIALQSAVLEAQERALMAREAYDTLARRKDELEEEIKRLTNWAADSARYELSSPSSGAFVYRLKPGMENGEPPHWLCANCYGNAQKSLLQSSGVIERATVGWNCFVCSVTVRVFGGVNPAKQAEAVGG